MRPDLSLSLQQARRLAPGLFFVGGFAWDALTLGSKVEAKDFALLGLYLTLAAGLIYWMARDRHQPEPWHPSPHTLSWQQLWGPWLRFNGPYLALQFLFGSLLSALFIFYFKSAGHLGTLLLSGLLASLLVGNEFLGRHYRHRFTLTWGMFGLCAMLLFNFIVPHLVGSLHPAWFYVSSFAGAAVAFALHAYAPGQPGRIRSVGALALCLALANLGDFIPPVPLVERNLLLGTDFNKTANVYSLQVEASPWWRFWQSDSRILHLQEGERLYCLAAVFAPQGLSTRLQHRWETLDSSGQWRVSSQASFPLTGGRQGGFRGYSFKDNPAPGLWRVSLLSEGGRTLSVTEFQVVRGEIGADARQPKSL